MSEQIKKQQLSIVILVGILLFLVIPTIAYFILVNDFHLKNFQEKIEMQVNEPFKLPEFNACYGSLFACTNTEYEYISEEIDTTKLGVYTVKYKLSFQNKNKEIEQVIEINDKKAPILNIAADHIKKCANGKIQELPIEAYDEYNGNISSNITNEIKNDSIIYKIVDESGNLTEKELPIIIEDDEFPTLTLNGEKTISIKKGSTYQEPGFKANDNCDGDLTDKVEVENDVNTNSIGEYHIKYSVKDNSGNATTTERIIYVYDVNENKNINNQTIYLTFDDGPSAYTGKLLDILNKYNVKVTFFVTNQSITKGYDTYIKRAYDEGHTIGLHTSTHDYKTIYSSEESYFNDLYAIQNKVKDITGHESRIIRFPGGSSNTISNFNPGIMSKLVKSVEAKGFHYFDWNLDSKDAGGANKTAEVASNVIKGLGSGKTYVVLQHDIKKYSIDAVETIIEYGLSHGYSFKALTTSSPNIHHTINN